jgi:signal-transduction protein with cAMP-binding, CBS, and nucleotidyltransferase domain
MPIFKLKFLIEAAKINIKMGSIFFLVKILQFLSLKPILRAKRD